jgi:D-alanyl-D-alanine dipeptidase
VKGLVDLETVGPVPAPPPSDRAWMIGQYGDHETNVDVAEVGGLLQALGPLVGNVGLDHVASHTFIADDGRSFRFERNGEVTTVVINGRSLRMRDLGAERIAAFQRTLELEDVAAAAVARQGKAMIKREFVSIARAVPGIRLDIRYASANNFAGFAMYERAEAYCRPVVATALARAQAELERWGYGLIIFDAYRPWSVTKFFWDIVPPASRAFVADPAVGSRHNRGCAIDLSLCGLASANEIEMPSRYDEPTARSQADYWGGTSRQRWHRDLLRAAMEGQGFIVHPDEWWHFDFHSWPDFDVEDVSFAALSDHAAGQLDTIPGPPALGGVQT